jgi:hypothetical protein
MGITGIWVREYKLLEQSAIFDKLGEFLVQLDLKLKRVVV